MYILLIIFSAITACGMTMHFLMGNIIQGLMGLTFLATMFITYELGKKQDAKWFSQIEFPMWFKAYVVLPSLGLMAGNTAYNCYMQYTGSVQYLGYFFVFVLIVTIITSYHTLYKQSKEEK